jgi:hypothetical protein
MLPRYYLQCREKIIASPVIEQYSFKASSSETKNLKIPTIYAISASSDFQENIRLLIEFAKDFQNLRILLPLFLTAARSVPKIPCCQHRKMIRHFMVKINHRNERGNRHEKKTVCPSIYEKVLEIFRHENMKSLE